MEIKSYYNIIKKFIAVLIFSLIVINYLNYDKYQFKPAVADLAYPSLFRVNNFVGRNDLIFVLKFDDHYNLVVTPLKYFFDFNTFTVNTPETIKNMLLANSRYFFNHYQNFFIFSDYPLFLKNNWLEYVASIPYAEGQFVIDAGFPPRKYFYNKLNFYLYQINGQFIRNLVFQKSGEFLLKEHPENLINFNVDRAWTKACSKIINLDYAIPSQNNTAINTVVSPAINTKSNILQINLNTGRKNWQTPQAFNLQVLANNNQRLHLIKVGNLNYQFSLPSSLSELNTLTICTSPFTPSKLGNNNDNRTLGLNIFSIKLLTNEKNLQTEAGKKVIF